MRDPKQVYETLSDEGEFQECSFDKDEVAKIADLAFKSYEYGKRLRKDSKADWRVIFNIHYDALRELCSALMRFKEQKISNHQGLFAFIVLNFPKFGFDWGFFEEIRSYRNKSKYMGVDIQKEQWKGIELQVDLYISALNEEIQKRLGELK
ncbi:MAG TPA: hypothetical protein VJH97_00045 [Candidatus Nanoarchaeia archaeon]|nr:hypothetical protein [Candidatus Nanoarchaeia archaeon]